MHHYCAACYHSDVRLYRIYGNFLRDGEIYCNAHIPPEPTRGCWVPLVEDTDGSVWGYTSAPPEALDRWRALPDYAAEGRTWAETGWTEGS